MDATLAHIDATLAHRHATLAHMDATLAHIDKRFGDIEAISKLLKSPKTDLVLVAPGSDIDNMDYLTGVGAQAWPVPMVVPAVRLRGPLLSALLLLAMHRRPVLIVLVVVVRLRGPFWSGLPIAARQRSPVLFVVVVVVAMRLRGPFWSALQLVVAGQCNI